MHQFLTKTDLDRMGPVPSRPKPKNLPTVWKEHKFLNFLLKFMCFTI